MAITPPLLVISFDMVDIAVSMFSSVPLVKESMFVLTRVYACWQNVVARVNSCLAPGDFIDSDLLALNQTGKIEEKYY